MDMELLSVVLVSLFLSVHAAPTVLDNAVEVEQAFLSNAVDADHCDALTAGIIDMVGSYVKMVKAIGAVDIDFKQVKEQVNFDFSDPKDVRKFSCKLIKVKTIKELAQLINQDYGVTKIYYTGMIKQIRDAGGYDKLMQRYHIGFDILGALNNTRFPTYPIGSQAFLEKFLNEMVEKYKSGFLQKISPGLKQITNVTETAEDLAKAKNANEFAAAVNTNPMYLPYVAIYYARIKPVICDIVKGLEASGRIKHVLQAVGFYKLQ